MKRQQVSSCSRLMLVLIMALISGLLAGCGTKEAPSTKTALDTGTPSAAQTVLTEWQKGQPADAVKQFVEADWSVRPLFPSSSPLSLSEDQFKALSESERTAKSAEVMPQLDALKQLARAVVQSGQEAAARQDSTLARKHFIALQQFGEALDHPDSMLIVKLVGRAFMKMADAEVKKL